MEAPIRAERKRHDGQTDARTIRHHRHALALPWVADEAAVDPAAQARKTDVAPAEAGDAAPHRDRHAARYLGDDRKVRCGSRVEIDGLIRECLRLGVRGRRSREQADQSGEHDTKERLAHCCLPLGEFTRALIEIATATVADKPFKPRWSM
jgi:hypothetical protein